MPKNILGTAPKVFPPFLNLTYSALLPSGALKSGVISNIPTLFVAWNPQSTILQSPVN